jgi:hypothetical protein
VAVTREHLTIQPRGERALTAVKSRGARRKSVLATVVLLAIVLTVVATLGAGVWFYSVVLMPLRRDAAADWGVRGDAMGPFVALLNAGALFAALYSVRLQRQELALQRKELTANRRVMKEQAKQARAAAEAQIALAHSQEKLAIAQQLTSEMALETHVLQVRNHRAELEKFADHLRQEIDRVYGTPELEQADQLEDYGTRLAQHQALMGAADAQLQMLEQMRDRTRADLAAADVAALERRKRNEGVHG